MHDKKVLILAALLLGSLRPLHAGNYQEFKCLLPRAKAVIDSDRPSVRKLAAFYDQFIGLVPNADAIAAKNPAQADALMEKPLNSLKGALANAKYDIANAAFFKAYGKILGPNHAAVRHLADIDMPCRGTTSDQLSTYLKGKNPDGSTVRSFFEKNRGLPK